MSNFANFKYDMIWSKTKITGHLNAQRRPMRAHESILVFSKGSVPYYPQMIQKTGSQIFRVAFKCHAAWVDGLFIIQKFGSQDQYSGFFR